MIKSTTKINELLDYIIVDIQTLLEPDKSTKIINYIDRVRNHTNKLDSIIQNQKKALDSNKPANLSTLIQKKITELTEENNRLQDLLISIANTRYEIGEKVHSLQNTLHHLSITTKLLTEKDHEIS